MSNVDRPMTKAELIKAIADFADDALILIEGQEAGFNGVMKVESAEVEYRPNSEWYNGKYAEVGPEPVLKSDFVGHKMAFQQELSARVGAKPAGIAIILKN